MRLETVQSILHEFEGLLDRYSDERFSNLETSVEYTNVNELEKLYVIDGNTIFYAIIDEDDSPVALNDTELTLTGRQPSRKPHEYYLLYIFELTPNRSKFAYVHTYFLDVLRARTGNRNISTLHVDFTIFKPDGVKYADYIAETVERFSRSYPELKIKRKRAAKPTRRNISAMCHNCGSLDVEVTGVDYDEISLYGGGQPAESRRQCNSCTHSW